MSFARTVKRIKDRESGKTGISIVDAIHEQVMAGERFSKKKTLHLLQSMQKAVEKHDHEAVQELLVDLYPQLLNMKDRERNVFHPSSVEGDCDRMLYFDTKGIPPTDRPLRGIKAPLQITFDLGTWFHHYAQHKLKKAGLLTQAEVPIKVPEKKIGGHMDGDLWIPEEAGLEIKTMMSMQFKKAQVANKPFVTHMKQAGVYGHFKGYKKIVFLYFNKDTSEMMEFHWDIDYKIVQPVLDKMDNILKAKKAPDRWCSNKGCQRALECPWKTYCFSK